MPFYDVLDNKLRDPVDGTFPEDALIVRYSRAEVDYQYQAEQHVIDIFSDHKDSDITVRMYADPCPPSGQKSHSQPLLEEWATTIGGFEQVSSPSPSRRRPVDQGRAQHLEWCKARALDYVAIGDLAGAFSSMMSDLRKHPGTDGHAAVPLSMMLMVAGHLDTTEKMRRHIEGFT